MILDTCFVIDVMRKDKQAVQTLTELELAGVQMHLSAISAFELGNGVGQSKRPAEEKQRIQQATKKVTQLSLTHAIAYKAGVLSGEFTKKGLDLGAGDFLIATTALETNDVLLTRNKKHFEKIPGLKVETY